MGGGTEDKRERGKEGKGVKKAIREEGYMDFGITLETI